MGEIQEATREENDIISFILENDHSNLCALHNLDRIQEVFEKFRDDIRFLMKIREIIEKQISDNWEAT